VPASSASQASCGKLPCSSLTRRAANSEKRSTPAPCPKAARLRGTTCVLASRLGLLTRSHLRVATAAAGLILQAGKELQQPRVLKGLRRGACGVSAGAGAGAGCARPPAQARRSVAAPSRVQRVRQARACAQQQPVHGRATPQGADCDAGRARWSARAHLTRPHTGQQVCDRVRDQQQLGQRFIKTPRSFRPNVLLNPTPHLINSSDRTIVVHVKSKLLKVRRPAVERLPVRHPRLTNHAARARACPGRRCARQ